MTLILIIFISTFGSFNELALYLRRKLVIFNMLNMGTIFTNINGLA